MNLIKGELQNEKGEIMYPHTSTNVVFDTKGNTLTDRLIEIENKIPVVEEYVHPATHDASMITGLPKVKNTLTETTTGNVLDARQGKVLNDRIDALVIPEEYVHPGTHDISMITGLPEVKNTLTEEIEGNVLDAVQGKILNDKIEEIKEDLGQRIGQRFRSNNGEQVDINNVMVNSKLQGLEIKGRTVNNLCSVQPSFIYANTSIVQKRSGPMYNLNGYTIYNTHTKEIKIALNDIVTDEWLDRFSLYPGEKLTISVDCVLREFTFDYSRGWIKEDVIYIDNNPPNILSEDTYCIYPLPFGLNTVDGAVTVNETSYKFYESLIKGETIISNNNLVSLTPNNIYLPALGSTPNVTDILDRSLRLLTLNTVEKKYTGDSSETWRISTLSLVNTICFVDDNAEGASVYSSGICTEFDYNSSNTDYRHIAPENNKILIFINRSELTTADINGFRTWLRSNPVTVRYELRNPTTIQLTEEEVEDYSQFKKHVQLHGVNTLVDTLTQDSSGRTQIVKNRKTIDFTDIKSFSMSVNGEYNIFTARIDGIQGGWSKKVDICNVLKNDVTGAYHGRSKGFAIDGSGLIYICLPATEANSVQEALQWCNLNNLTIDTGAKEPSITYVDYKSSTNIVFYNKNTRIYFNNTVKPSSYYVDVLVDKLIYDEDVTLTKLYEMSTDLEKQIALLEFNQLLQ